MNETTFTSTYHENILHYEIFFYQKNVGEQLCETWPSSDWFETATIIPIKIYVTPNSETFFWTWEKCKTRKYDKK
mgnify:CR=1 FL=1